MIPANLLALALSIIGSQTVSYMKYNGRTTNEVGQDIASYDAPIDLKGSFQPVPTSLYAQNGLDFSKKYYTFYASSDLLDIQRDVSGDKLIYAERTYQIEDENDWFVYNGWKGVLCVRQ